MGVAFGTAGVSVPGTIVCILLVVVLIAKELLGALRPKYSDVLARAIVSLLFSDKQCSFWRSQLNTTVNAVIVPLVLTFAVLITQKVILVLAG